MWTDKHHSQQPHDLLDFPSFLLQHLLLLLMMNLGLLKSLHPPTPMLPPLAQIVAIEVMGPSAQHPSLCQSDMRYKSANAVNGNWDP